MAIMPQIRPWATALGIELIREAKNPMNKTSELFGIMLGKRCTKTAGKEPFQSSPRCLFVRVI